MIYRFTYSLVMYFRLETKMRHQNAIEYLIQDIENDIYQLDTVFRAASLANTRVQSYADSELAALNE